MQEVMPRMNKDIPRVHSRGFALWKQLEARRGRTFLEAFVEATGVNLLTIRKFVAKPDADVSGCTLGTAKAVAKFLGSTLDGMFGDPSEMSRAERAYVEADPATRAEFDRLIESVIGKEGDISE